ncbi:hypothetical protein EDD68_10278 [Melghiribacillus thermohalophilus]|uniref:Uncharacterized protein n=1 Tax=Melghiribacillus thermohalophilus TaxID=1324956 RepID=A0A4R3NGR0_9BACI|nr:hypothetical protein [Melghiribacillus thermohalophilus]TCT26377.1 hypothetical protein EDD68_10278 [Melghiribacillus thermohalophilus]
MANIVSIRKPSKIKALILGVLTLGLLATSVSAASSTALLQYESNAEGPKINIHDGASRMTVTNAGGGPYQLIGYAKKYVAIFPDPTVHTSYARPVTEVRTNFYPDPSTYYPEAYGEYNTDDLYGAVNITD